jgi:hypothetical protein
VPYESIEVECYSGYRVNERPLAFIHRGRRWAVAEVIDRWYEGGVRPGAPALDYFKVRTSEGKIFLLRYNTLFDAWGVRTGGRTAH